MISGIVSHPTGRGSLADNFLKSGAHGLLSLKYIQELLGDRNDMLSTVEMAQMVGDRTELWLTALSQPKDDDDDDDDDLVARVEKSWRTLVGW